MKTLAVYLTAGYPDTGTFLKAASVAADDGVDLFVVGLPFSDPIADGPVIQKTSEEAIRRGMNYERMLDLADRCPPNLARVLMTYSNPLFVRGWSRAFDEISRCGFSGCVLPDVPADELMSLLPFRPPRPFYLVPFVAPTTSAGRLAAVASAARDGAFIFLVSLRGITGSRLRDRSMNEIDKLARSIRRLSHASIYAGFGVRTGADAARLSRFTDGVIVGTAALQALRRSMPAYARLLRQLRRSLDRVSP